ncbi:FecR family protein [Chitinophaga arvensicola]|uniref:FecR protein n=1 Tax=Chitinophaga arvensicola TaxID=29529 RepID=A0A1I0RAL1_9BACT|nr:FecR domain-containing protein [Chitinophaga arvensicola]SEW37821.1 FecR protein [Chitinophaga arvensicola]
MDQHNDIDWHKLLDALEEKEAVQGTLSVEETQLLGELRAIRSESAALLQDVRSYDTDGEWKLIRATMQIESNRYKNTWKYVTAAAAVLLLGIAVSWWMKPPPAPVPQPVADIAPGRTGATLTLPNGKSIHLSDQPDGEINRSAGVVIKKGKDGELVYSYNTAAGETAKGINVLSTARRESYRLQLPDGTNIWLNAATTLKYDPSAREGGIQEISLEGEAYFEVAPHPGRPFVVQTATHKLEVLGTRFNISSYKNEQSARTTLLDGAVKISHQADSRVLKPGQQAIVTASGIVSVKETDVTQAAAWKNNQLVFDGEQIEDIMKMIERWYDVEVVYAGEKPRDKFIGGVSRLDSVSQVLKVLETTGGAHFKMEGRRIVVTK